VTARLSLPQTEATNDMACQKVSAHVPHMQHTVSATSGTANIESSQLRIELGIGIGYEYQFCGKRHVACYVIAKGA